MVEMFVYRVALDVEQGTAVVLLTEEEPVQRLLPIWIRVFEAQAIAMELHGETPPRPYTHDLMAAIVAAVGWRLDHISITDLRDTTFYAVLSLEQDGQVVEVDARPSDSIALALRCDARIYVADDVLEKAAIVPGPETPEDDVDAFRRLMSGVDLTVPESGEEPGPPLEPEPPGDSTEEPS
ncbi:MAG TPA: bifunctional nuclease family protein [Armatimonadota bacterium]|jgi:hypothetical protein